MTKTPFSTTGSLLVRTCVFRQSARQNLRTPIDDIFPCRHQRIPLSAFHLGCREKFRIISARKNISANRNGPHPLSFDRKIHPARYEPAFFRPAIGIRYDDHTVVSNQVAGGDYTSLIPPAYAEYGAEYSFNGLEWFSASAGIFSARNLSEVRVKDSGGGQVSLISNRDRPSALLRLELRRPLLEGAVYLQGGSSYLENGDFNLENVFLGAGLGHRVSVLGEFIHSSKHTMQRINNGTMDVTYKFTHSLLLYVRGERGVTRFTREAGVVKTYMNLGTAGAQIFLFPHVELRPEFRIVDTEQYRSTRYYVQLHLYY